MREENLREDIVVEEQQEKPKMPKGKLKITKKGAVVLTTAVVVLVVSVTGIVHSVEACLNKTPEIEQDTTKIVLTIKDDTQLDEVLELVDKEAAMNLDELEEVVNLSETLHNLNLEQYIGGLVKYDMPEEYKVEDVTKMIDIFNELIETPEVKNNILSDTNRDFTKLCLVLESLERRINGDLSNESYATLVNYGIPTVKSKLLDACGFDASEVTSMRIGAGEKAYVISFTDKETGKVYNVPAAQGSNLNSKGYVHDVISNIYDWQDSSKLANNTGDTYDGKRNKDILEGINMLKTLTLMNCEINDEGKLEVTTSIKEVKDKVKTLDVLKEGNK